MKNSQHYFVSQDINGASSFTQTINIPFQPDRMVMHYSVYYNDGTETLVSLIRCPDLVRSSDSILTTIIDNGIKIGSSEFQMGFKIAQTITFQVLNISKALDTTRQGYLVIDLEFIED
jgi:hypothetical protein